MIKIRFTCRSQFIAGLMFRNLMASVTKEGSSIFSGKPLEMLKKVGMKEKPDMTENQKLFREGKISIYCDDDNDKIIYYEIDVDPKDADSDTKREYNNLKKRRNKIILRANSYITGVHIELME